MTLALAAVCTDGVVIVEDKALTRMDTFELLKYDEKLRGVIRNVIFGYGGVENLYDIFVKCVVGELVMLRDNQVQKYGSDIHRFRRGLPMTFQKVKNGAETVSGVLATDDFYG